MTDTLTFDDDINLLGVLGTGLVNLTGTIDVDYGTTNTVVGSLSFDAVGAVAAQTYSNFTLTQTGTSSGGLPIYQLVGTSPLPTITTLTITYTGELPTTDDATITVAGVLAGSGSGTVTSSVVCFASGTLIRTLRGDVAVEDLQIGDHAVTASGAIRPITWIGHRTIVSATHPEAAKIHPVRIRAGAFGADLPERDLFLSPGHPVLVGEDDDEVLVPIMCLINGTSIAHMPVDSVTYWHVELDEHDILLAEGLAAESFLDWGNRPWFGNGADHALTNPDFIPPGLGARCRPVATDGPLVEAERRRLDLLFSAELIAQCAWPTAQSAWLTA